MDNSNIRYKLHWNLKWNSYIFIQENAFEYVVCKIAVILSRLQCVTLQWRHNGCDGVSNHHPHGCLLNRLYRAQIRENIKAPRHWPLCGDSPVTGEFFAQKASYAENVSIWWRHHEVTSQAVDKISCTEDIVSVIIATTMIAQMCVSSEYNQHLIPHFIMWLVVRGSQKAN